MAHSPLVLLVWTSLVLGLVGNIAQTTEAKDVESIYNFTAIDIDGSPVSFEKYRGYVLIVVNVASECGLTESNYAQLNDLYSRYANEGLRIAAFPSNQFNQEPGDEATIKQFVAKHNATFDVYSKVDVNGDKAHPVFKWLKSKLSGFLFTESIKWNFTKFLLDSNGEPIKRYGPLEKPKDIESDLIRELQKRTDMLKHLAANKSQQEQSANTNSNEKPAEL